MLLLGGATAFAQHRMTLEDLSEFRPQAGNWQIVGEVETNPFPVAADKSEKKRKRRRSKENEEAEDHAVGHVQFGPGTGILLNINDEQNKDALLTTWEHGDILLELEVMLPRGSNSGIYLQGRYEVQLFDSWGVLRPRFSDMGGIYRNWIEDPEMKFMGIPPSSNPSRAPGLWQHMKIHFRAPRFNEQGEKMENARFVLVQLNGVPIHENVEVPRPTGGPISGLESSRGPLMIQGDHGPVAFRNIRYTLLEPSDVRLTGLNYRAFEGSFESLSELEGAEPAYIGETEKLEAGVARTENNYGLIYEGILEILKGDEYTLSLGFTGGGSLTVNDRRLIEHNSSSDHGVLDHTIRIEEGSYPIRIEAIKSAGWYPPRLGFWVRTATTEAKAFHTEESFSRLAYSVPAILVEPEAKPRLLRGFVRFGGGDLKLSHTIAVGTPWGIHYAYDLNKGNVIGLWRGDFVDATPMWRDRGDGSFQLLGDVCWTFPGQPLMAPGDQSQAFTGIQRHTDFVPGGYSLDRENGLPVFRYAYCDYEVEHRLMPAQDRRSLVQQLRFQSRNPLAPPTQDQITRTDSSYVFKLAEGNRITALGNRSFRIDDAYYIRIIDGPQAFERNTDLGTELCVPVEGDVLTYEILW